MLEKIVWKNSFEFLKSFRQRKFFGDRAYIFRHVTEEASLCSIGFDLNKNYGCLKRTPFKKGGRKSPGGYKRLFNS